MEIEGFTFLMSPTGYITISEEVRINYGNLLIAISDLDDAQFQGIELPLWGNKPIASVIPEYYDMDIQRVIGNISISNAPSWISAALRYDMFSMITNYLNDEYKEETFWRLFDEINYLTSLPSPANPTTINELFNVSLSFILNVIHSARILIQAIYDGNHNIIAKFFTVESGEILNYSFRICSIEDTFVKMYHTEQLMDIILLDTVNILEQKNKIDIKKCENCGKWFIPEYRSDAKYCTRKAPQDDVKTCQEYGSYAAWVDKSKNDACYSVYRKKYMQKQMAAKRNPDIPEYRESFEAFKAESKKWKEDVKSGDKTSEEYLKWLEQA